MHAYVFRSLMTIKLGKANHIIELLAIGHPSPPAQMDCRQGRIRTTMAGMSGHHA
ncbi:hypothetical protein CLV67_11089 [Actinoplanes italicus]|uniref:Uncharacterized protein n=1 Tax=Actinoplanes italicus TaxID=113567 RepID=A0A2T0K8F3_9ACTN|nr:hypothetical protein CLV67_11089 [Actinoplanes italicus]